MDTRKRLKRQSNRKARIIDAASRLVVERGMEDVSLTAIAQAAGISKGTLYYYYATKAALVFDIAEKHVRDITDVIFELIETGGPQTNPEVLIGLLFQKHKSNHIRMRLHLNLVGQAMNGNDDLKQRYQETYAYWHARALEALSRLFPAYDDRETLAHLLITIIDGLNVQTMLGVDTVSVNDLARFIAVRTSA
ncbi:MAG: TetR/AcrR family transcriptional regulator [Desulfobacteraceae bacterium]|nr:TetR/AcrR family transcriptional regulator [Desulfobacteraceae bacterium]MBC2752680.1 TetR/AcrR family transcriptional regulator [Desulfobacteraceae bacterium]